MEGDRQEADANRLANMFIATRYAYLCLGLCVPCPYPSPSGREMGVAALGKGFLRQCARYVGIICGPEGGMVALAYLTHGSFLRILKTSIYMTFTILHVGRR